MNQKLEELIATAHLNDLLHQKKEEEKKANMFACILVVLGILAAIAGIVFAVVKYVSPSYLDDDFDDFDDDFDDDFYSEDDFTTEE